MLICPLCADSVTLLGGQAQDRRQYGHCTPCDLRFLHPEDRLTPSEEKAHYEHHNNDVDDPHYQNFVSPICETVNRMFAPGAKGLDFGAGPGPVLMKMLGERGYQVDVYDPFYWPERKALQTTYDFIVACEVAEHFYDPLAEFQKLHDLLNKGGALVLMSLLVTEETDFARWYYRNDPTHVVFYSVRTLTWIKEKIGFASLETDGKRLIILTK